MYHSWLEWGALNPLAAPNGDRSPKIINISTAMLNSAKHIIISWNPST
ncbi:hypothetical protein JW935_05530 [candidate division KSB1 bacterium]|nr:hypothetical protein [candidate division KSB1 bacterium]